MADNWWESAPLANAPQGDRIGYIPGIPKKPTPPAGYRDDGNGGYEIIPGGPADPERPGGEYDPNKPASANSNKLTEGERKGGSFAKRALGAYQDYEALGLGPRGIVNNAINGISPSLANTIPSAIGGNDSNRQQADAAENEFLTAILRQDSGATITPDELASQRAIYFPRVGETSPEVLEAKRQKRLRALKALVGAAGGGADTETLDGIQSVATGDTRRENDPGLVGLNDQVRQMLTAGASDADIIKTLKERGITNPRELVEVKNGLLKIRQAQKQGYKGDLNVNLDDRIVPNTAFEKIAASPFGAAGIAAADTISGGHLDNAVNALGGDGDLANLGIEQMRQNNPGSAFAGDILGGAALFGAGGAAARGLGAAGGAAETLGAFAPRALAADAATGAYVSSGQGGTQIADPGNMVMGGLLGGAAGAAGRGAVNTVASAVSPTGGALAPLYASGVRPTVGQRMGASESWAGRAANRAEQAFGSVPLLGGVQRSGRNAAVTEMQAGAFNEALGEIGVQLPKGIKKGWQAHDFMQKEFSKAYDKALSGMRYVPDEGLEEEINALAPDASLLAPQSQAILQKMTNDIGHKLAASGGELGGEQYKLVVSRLTNKIGSLRSSPSGDHELAGVLERAKLAIQNAARRSSDPKAVAALDAADRGYAKAVIIENAGKARGGESGEFNGNQLHAAMQKSDKSRRSRAFLRGEAHMQDYAEAAKKLGDELPDSGTTERAMAMGGGAAAAHFLSPWALAPWAVDTAANLPGVRQTLGALMAPRESATTRAIADALRRRAQLGGLMAAPGAIEGQ